MNGACDKIKESLYDYADGRVCGELEKDIREHLEGCEDCRREYSEIVSMLGDIKASEKEVPASFAASVMDSVAKYERTKKRKSVFAKISRYGSMAAAFLVVLVSAVFIMPRVFEIENTDSGENTTYNTGAMAENWLQVLPNTDYTNETGTNGEASGMLDNALDQIPPSSPEYNGAVTDSVTESDLPNFGEDTNKWTNNGPGITDGTVEDGGPSEKPSFGDTAVDSGYGEDQGDNEVPGSIYKVYKTPLGEYPKYRYSSSFVLENTELGYIILERTSESMSLVSENTESVGADQSKKFIEHASEELKAISDHNKKSYIIVIFA